MKKEVWAFRNDKVNLAYDDVALVTGLSTISSRAEIDLVTPLPKGLSLGFPVLTAAMDTITSGPMAKALLDAGGGVVHHRNQSLLERCAVLSEHAGHPGVIGKRALNGVAIGLEECTTEAVAALIDHGANLICIELAHAWHVKVVAAVKAIGPLCQSRGVLLMVGNFSDTDAVPWLANEVGDLVDIIKVGQGAGSACTTRLVTGIGKPGWQAVIDMTTLRNMPYHVVADGGIRNSGHLAKALGAGAMAGMLGGMLAGCDECPGDIITGEGGDGKKYKEFRGMASSLAKGSEKNVEGIQTKVPYKGPVSHVLNQIRDGLQSSISCCGYTSLGDFRRNAQFLRVSDAGKAESVPHAMYQAR